MGNRIEFIAEIKEVKQTKPQLDNIYSFRVITDDSGIMDLGKLPADKVVKVIVEYGRNI